MVAKSSALLFSHHCKSRSPGLPQGANWSKRYALMILLGLWRKPLLDVDPFRVAALARLLPHGIRGRMGEEAAGNFICHWLVHVQHTIRLHTGRHERTSFDAHLGVSHHAKSGPFEEVLPPSYDALYRLLYLRYEG